MTERRVLVLYRRADAAGIAGRIFDRLTSAYGPGAVFMDVDSIPFGQDFRAHIRDSLARCSVVLVVIGPRWLGPREGGSARIHDADDPVRVEVETSIEKGVPIIPVLVDGARMPAASDLPGTLQSIPFLNAATVDVGVDFHQHVDRLMRSIDKLTGRDAHAGGVSGLRGSTATRIGWGLAAAAALALPVAASHAAIEPPWPPGVVIVTMVVVLVTMLVAVQFLRVATARGNHRVLVASGGALLLSTCVYLLASSFFTYAVPTTRERFVKGFRCTSEAQLLYKDKCPYLGIDELQTAEYEAERLWTASSVATVKVSLVGLWLAGFIAMATLVGSLLVRYSRQAAAGTFLR